VHRILRRDSFLIGAPWLAALLLATGLAASVGAFMVLSSELESHQRREFDWVAHNRNNALKKGIQDGLNAVKSVGDLFTVSPDLDQEAFSRYAQALLERYRGIHTLEWVPAVPTEQREAHEREGRAHSSDYHLIEHSGDARRRPAADRPTYFPIYYMEPLRQDGRLIGFDYGSNTLYRGLIERARDSGRMVVSGRIKLLQGEEAQYGVQAFLPVYRSGTPPSTLRERRKALLGLAVGVFRIANLASASISLLEPRGVEFLIRDESAPPREAFLDFYASRLTPPNPSVNVSRASPGWNIKAAPKLTETFPVADRLWSITCSPTHQFRSAESFREGPWIVLIGGLALTLMMALFVVHTLRGMRARLHIEQELRESEQKLRILFDQSPDLIATLDRAGRVLLANRPVPGVFPEYAVGRLFADLLPARYQARYRRAVDKAFETGQSDVMEFSREDSSWWDLRIVPLKVSAGVKAVMVIATDVTEKRLLEAQAIRNARLASLGTIVASVAHEINNPNNSIRFNTSVLMRSWRDILEVLKNFWEEHGDFTIGGVPVDQALGGTPRLLEGIDKGTRRIERIVGTLKHMARPDAGELDHGVDLAEVLSTGLSILQSQIHKCCDDCHLEIREPLAQVRGNPQQLEQVFINLVQNALESLPERSRGVLIRAQTEAEGEFVRVSVKDQGRGIPEDLRGKVLEPFFTTRGTEGGTGLGLSIAYRIVQNHSGRLEILDAPNGGTEVVVRLPVRSSV
jgi:PAS domain S-box-containing protein